MAQCINLYRPRPLLERVAGVRRIQEQRADEFAQVPCLDPRQQQARAEPARASAVKPVDERQIGRGPDLDCVASERNARIVIVGEGEDRFHDRALIRQVGAADLTRDAPDLVQMPTCSVDFADLEIHRRQTDMPFRDWDDRPSGALEYRLKGRESLQCILESADLPFTPGEQPVMVEPEQILRRRQRLSICFQVRACCVRSIKQQVGMCRNAS